MGLLSKLKTMFNKNKQINTKDTTIVPYDTSLVILPQYKELSKEEQEEVEKYKQEIKAGDISSLILYAGQLSEYANVNVTLLTKVFFKLTNQPADWQLEKMDLEEIMRMRLEAKVNKEELQIYLAGLKKLEQESILRAVAVEEVRKQENKRKFEFLGLFSQAERMHRKNQLEQISSAKERMLITVKTMEQLMQAVNNTIGNEEKIETAIDVYDVVLRNRLSNHLEEYRKKLLATGVARAVGRAMQLYEWQDHHNEATKRKVLIQKIDEISELANLIFQEKEGILNSKEIEDYIDTEEIEARFIREIARMQRKITVYAYTHKQDVEKLREHLDKIIQIHVTPENKEFLLKRISNIQKLYQIFQETIKEEDLEKLYKTKFTILVDDINRMKRRNSPIEQITDKQELEYYAKIVESKIEKILHGEGRYFEAFKTSYMNEKDYERDLKIVLESFKRIVKSKSGNFSGDTILQDKRKLGLIIAFDTENGIKEFGEFSYFKRTDTKYVLIDGTYEWEESLPLRTIYYLDKNANSLIENEKSFKKETGMPMKRLKWKLNTSSERESLIDDFKLLYAYSFMTIKRDKDVFKLPEGIRGIKEHIVINYGDKPNIYEFILFDGISRNRKLEFPKSLKYIGNEAFMHSNSIEEIVFNEGLEKIGESVFLGCLGLKEVILPNSVKEIGSACFESCTELERIFINERIQRIGRGAFYNTKGLRFFSIPQHKFYCEEMFEDLPIAYEEENDGRIVLQVRGTKLPRNFLKQFETNGIDTYTLTSLFGPDERYVEGKRYAQISAIEYAPYNQSPKRCLIKYDNAATVLEKITKIEKEYDKEVSNGKIE